MSEVAEEVAPGIWWWTTRHPEWHPGAFGAEVGAYALVIGDELLLVDPLLPEPGDDDAGESPTRAALLDQLDALATDRRVHLAITIGYHVRSAEPLADRYSAPAIHGPKQCASRLTDPARLSVVTAGEEGPAGTTFCAIGKPRRAELPLWVPAHRALVLGDALVTTPEGELRMWAHDPVDERVTAFYRDRFAPTLGPLIDLDPEHVLTTHGPPVISDGGAALRGCAAARPWYHRG